MLQQLHFNITLTAEPNFYSYARSRAFYYKLLLHTFRSVIA